jgi:signal transduction histidine kinase
MPIVQILFYFVVIIFTLGLAVFVSQKKKNKTGSSFSFLLLISALWLLLVFLFFFTEDHRLVLWFGRASFSAVLLTVFYLLRFVIIFPLPIEKLQKLIPIKAIGIGTFFFAIITFFTPLVIENEVIIGIMERETSYGILYPFWVFYFGILCLLSVLIPILQYRNVSGGIEKKQIVYIFLGTGSAVVFSFISFIVLTAFEINDAEAYGGPIALAIVFSFTTYAILKHRFMDIAVATGKVFTYALTIFSIIFIAYVFYFLNSYLNLADNYLLIITAIIVSLLSQPLFTLFKKFASRYFYYSFYSSQKVLEELSKKLTRILDINELASLTTKTITETMKLDRAVILIKKGKDGRYIIQKNIGFKEENGISLVKDNFLTEYLEKNQKPLVYEELSVFAKETYDKEEEDRIKSLQENMKRIEASLCLPLLVKDKISGMIVLGNKISGDPYFEQDIDLLMGLSNQASIALYNAQLYSEVQDLSQNLERRVSEQVKELKQAYNKLQKLDKVKTEFMSIISHQLRTPLSIVKGHLSMINEGVYDDNEERKKEILDNVYEANERLIALVNDVLNISRIQSGRVEINKEKVNLVELTRRTTERMMPSADEKGIKLIFHKNEEDLPEIKIDVAKIENVIINLVDNAIKYTNEGQVEVFVKKEEKNLLIEIKDSGEGMMKDELEKLFDTFSRGDAGKKHWIQGAGLGLYIARQFVEMHKGKVWAESEGEGKGSQFYIKLPL